MERNAVHPPRLSFEGVDRSDLHGLLPLLQWLDDRLEQVLGDHPREQGGIEHAPRSGAKAGETTENLLVEVSLQNSRSTLEPAIDREYFEQINLRQGTPIAWLRQTFLLSPWDLAVLMIALAPELDRRYEKLYAYLQDDARCLRPTVDLALELLCATPLERLAQRRIFASDGPLLHHGLLHLVANGEYGNPTLLNRELHLAEPVVQLLLGQSGLTQALMAHCHWHGPQAALAQAPFEAEWAGLQKLVLAAANEQRPLRLYVQGADRDRTRTLVMALASHLQLPVLSADISALVRDKVALGPLLKQMVRSAWFQGALLYLDNLDSRSQSSSICTGWCGRQSPITPA
jgi:hypothetical protein